jgi:hypothetical protein
MSTEPHATSLYPALLAAMRDFNPVVKNKQNPHLKNFYADLGAVLEAVTEPLASHGLLIVQRFSSDQGTPILITEIVHAESGQSIASALPVICKDPTDPQKLGGAITYARRYSLVAILSLTAEDDDGNAASKPAPPRQQPAAEQPRPAPASTGTPAPAANGGTFVKYNDPGHTASYAPQQAVREELAARKAAQPSTSPAITRDADWTDVWSTARPMGIKDRAALDQWLGGEGAQGLLPWQILARLKEAAAPAAPPPSH